MNYMVDGKKLLKQLEHLNNALSRNEMGKQLDKIIEIFTKDF
jgi:hypothetical protein